MDPTTQHGGAEDEEEEDVQDGDEVEYEEDDRKSSAPTGRAAYARSVAPIVEQVRDSSFSATLRFVLSRHYLSLALLSYWHVLRFPFIFSLSISCCVLMFIFITESD